MIITLGAFLAYVAIESLEILSDPISFLNGLLLRVLVLIVLLRGVLAGARYRELMQLAKAESETPETEPGPNRDS